MVGVPGYWDGYYLRGEESFDRVKELQGMGEYALLLESSFCNEVHFIKGNSLVVVSAKRGGDGSDVQLLAQIIADQLPDELPHPDTWQLEVPEPARQLTLPGKYIYKVYKSGEQNVFFTLRPIWTKCTWFAVSISEFHHGALECGTAILCLSGRGFPEHI